LKFTVAYTPVCTGDGTEAIWEMLKGHGGRETQRVEAQSRSANSRSRILGEG